MIRFDFKDFKVTNPIDKLKFIVDKKVLAYNYHRLIEPSDFREIFQEIDNIL